MLLLFSFFGRGQQIFSRISENRRRPTIHKRKNEYKVAQLPGRLKYLILAFGEKNMASQIALFSYFEALCNAMFTYNQSRNMQLAAFKKVSVLVHFYETMLNHFGKTHYRISGLSFSMRICM